MRALLLFTLTAATPAHALSAAGRTAPEPSDVALFLFATGAIWWTRRALRRRLPRKD